MPPLSHPLRFLLVASIELLDTTPYKCVEFVEELVYGHLRKDQLVRHWESPTMVVDTTNYNGKNNFRGSSKNMHLVERFTRIDADTINYEATVNDPTVWTKPWTVLNPLRRDSSGFFEYACHEGNFAMVGMLSGARAKEKAKTAVTKGRQ